MEERELSQALQTLAAFFGGNVPPGRVQAVYPLVRHLPGGEPLAWMVRHIQESHDTMPRNVARALRDAWAAWQRAHPQQVERRREERGQIGCGECHDGWIWVQRRRTGIAAREYLETAVVACPRCRPGGEGGIPARSLRELQEAGWQECPREVRVREQMRHKNKKAA